MRALIKTGAKVNQQYENGRTCLHIAALEGHTQTVIALLEVCIKAFKGNLLIIV